jgi:ferritin
MENIKKFEFIISSLIKSNVQGKKFFSQDTETQLKNKNQKKSQIAQSLNTAFIVLLAGKKHPLYKEAYNHITKYKINPVWSEIADFYFNGLKKLRSEIKNITETEAQINKNLDELYQWCQSPNNFSNKDLIIENFWKFFFPEGVTINENKESLINDLRQKRKVQISKLNSNPIQDATKEILFTSNLLLTIPSTKKTIDKLPYNYNFKEKLKEASKEKQIYWYDHPIQIGVSADKNEILYGLRGLQNALKFEKRRASLNKKKLTCILSISVTHNGLHNITRDYIRQELLKSHILEDLDVYVFSENDTHKIFEKILLPAAKQYTNLKNFESLKEVFGVDGEYGKHYSLLKSILALWNLLIDPYKRATFKIDLDQVFPQEELVTETGLSAFEHLQTPLWGAEGVDSLGQKVVLGMLAGALVNENDISKSLFTPDVLYPQKELSLDEYFFFSQLPQALSTEAEMMVRYTNKTIDVGKNVSQRIHVTGGTTGILVESLYKFRPFTPTFFGRAEDQTYILSAINKEGKKLSYLHAAGLIMRHDKEIFAQEAIKKAKMGKIVSEYIRILYFSKYGEIIQKEYSQLKEILNPFTGCFYSQIPITIVLLRFVFKVSQLFYEGKENEAMELLALGVNRIPEAIKFAYGSDNQLEKQYQKEKKGWDLYYQILEEIKLALKRQDPKAVELKKKAQLIIENCRISF